MLDIHVNAGQGMYMQLVIHVYVYTVVGRSMLPPAAHTGIDNKAL